MLFDVDAVGAAGSRVPKVGIETVLVTISLRASIELDYNVQVMILCRT